MKDKIIALTLLAFSGLVAQEPAGSQSYTTQNDCCDPCAPCCVPKPKKCIDCECYVPSYYDLQCDWGASINVDFLYWYASETNLAYAGEIFATDFLVGANTTRVSAPTAYEYINAQWKPGFRIGLGWNMECDGWDSNLNWTYYHNKASNHTSVADFGTTANPTLPLAGQVALINPWTNLGFAAIFGKTFDNIKAKWSLNFNQIDWELGRQYWLSKCFTLRPFAALRGAWTKSTFKTTSSRTPEAGGAGTTSFKDRFTNRVWGVGFLAGIQPNWFICENFAIFANMDAALLWGKFQPKKKESYTAKTGDTTVVTLDYVNNMSSHFFMMQPVIDVALGLRWIETWCCDRFRTALDLGWEHHVWFDFNHRMKTNNLFAITEGTAPTTQSAHPIGFAEATGNVGMGGLVVRLRFDF